MFKFTLVGDDLDTVRGLLVEKVLSISKEMGEDMHADVDSADYTARTMWKMRDLNWFTELYLKSINKMEVVDG
jgi:hypothetical protein